MSKRKSLVKLAGLAGLCVICLATVCWIWDGQNPTILTFDQCLELAPRSEAAMEVLRRKLADGIEVLQGLALRDDAIGRRARAKIAILRERLRP